MILSTRKTAFYLCKSPTDMRLGFDGLSELVKKSLRKNPYSGQYFAFINRRRTSCKVYAWDGTGEVVISKRLSVGQFCRPNPGYKRELKLSSSEFGQFFEGLNMAGRLLESLPNTRPRRRGLCFVPPYRTLRGYGGGESRTGAKSYKAQGAE